MKKQISKKKAKPTSKSKSKIQGKTSMFKNKLFIPFAVMFILGGILALRLTLASDYNGYQRLAIVNMAKSQLGHKEYGSQVLKYTEGNKEDWCANFVSWVYKEAGYPFVTPATSGKSSWRIPVVYKQFSSAPNLRDYFVQNYAYKGKETGYVPAPGDIVIFSRQSRSHTGIVERTDKPANKNELWVHTIEGNTDTDNVARRSYPISHGTIDGYGVIINKKPSTSPPASK